MTRKAAWMIRLFVLVMVVTAGVALLAPRDLPQASVQNAGSTAVQPSSPCQAANASFAAEPSQAIAQEGGDTAACRRAPECSVDSDCDVLCGVGLGKCVHASCPTRVCKCR